MTGKERCRLFGKKRSVMHTQRYGKALKISIIVACILLIACLIAYGWQKYEENKYPNGTEKDYKLPNAFLNFAGLVSDFIHQNDVEEVPLSSDDPQSETVTKIVVGTPDENPPEEVPEPVVIGGVVEEQPRVFDSDFNNVLFVGDYFVSTAKAEGFFPEAIYVTANDLDINTMLTKKVFKLESETVTMAKYIASLENIETIYLILSPESVSWMDYPTFVKKCMDFFSELKAAQPDAEIYIQGILPICEELSQKHSYSVTNREIDQINTYLKEISLEKEFWFLDTPEIYKTKNGDLAQENTSNGIRLLPESYQNWYEYLLTHKVTH